MAQVRRALVMGAAGFLGSHLVDRLLRDGWYVHGLDDLSTGSFMNLPVHPSFYFTCGDVRERFLGVYDVVFNLACPASPKQYQRSPIKTWETSVLGARNVSLMHARIVHASTSEVYGEPLVHPQPESYWGNVNPRGLRSCYDEGKRAAEALLCDVHRAGADIRIARIFNTYGPRMALDDGRVVSNFVHQALTEEPLTVFGDGRQTRSFCYVGDLIDGLVRLAEVQRLDDPVVNLGSQEEVSILELARVVADVVGVPLHRESHALPSDDPTRRCPDITRARKLLGFQARTPLREGIVSTVSNFRTRT